MAKKKPLQSLTDTFTKSIVDQAQQLIKDSGHKANKRNIKKVLKSYFGKNLIPHLVSECVKMYRDNKKTAMENFNHEIRRIAKALTIEYLKTL